MKPVFTQWATKWTQDPRCKGWILSSWEVVTNPISARSSAQDLQGLEEEQYFERTEVPEVIEVSKEDPEEDPENDDHTGTDHVIPRKLALGLRPCQ